MPMSIFLHPKGLRLDCGPDVLFSSRELQRLLGVPPTPLGKRSYLVASQYAYLVIKHFPPGRATWADDALGYANLQATHHGDQIRARVEVDYALEHAMEILSDYPLLYRLDPHQIEAVAAIAVPSLQGIAIFDEQGTGKTVMALCGYDRLRQQGQVDRLLIIAPKSVLGSWKHDAEMLFGAEHTVSVVDSAEKRRRSQILAWEDILAINYETAAAEQALLTSILSSSSYRSLLVVDESYYVKNPEARRTQVVTALRAYCTRAVVLCGTPAPNSPHDIIQQVNIADKGVAFGDQSIPKERDEARTLIADALGQAIYLRRLKQEVLPDIPDKHIETILFDLKPIQRTLYECAYEELVLDVRSADDTHFVRHLASFLARRIALLQICSHPGVIDLYYDEVPAKQLALDQLLHDIVDLQGKKVVLWSYFRYSLEALAQRYGHYGLVRIDGSVTSVDARIEAITRFQSDPAVRVFLGNAAAAGAGITLTAAHHAIYESFSNQAAHYMQSVDRIHRRGQVYDVTYHILLARDTIESGEFDRILEKERLGRELLGDTYEEPMTRERFLAEIGALLN